MRPSHLPSTFRLYSEKIRLSFHACLLICFFLPSYESTSSPPFDISQFTADQLRDTFGVEDSRQAPIDRSIVSPKFECIDADVRHLNVLLPATQGKYSNLTLHAVDDTLFNRDAVVIIRDEEGGHRMHVADSYHPAEENCHFRTSSEQNGLVGAVSTCDGNMRGVIIDSSDGSTYVIHPLPADHSRGKRNAHGFVDHVVYKRGANATAEMNQQNQIEENVIEENSHFCGMNQSLTSSDEDSFEDLFVSNTNTHESLAVIAHKLTQESDLVVEIAMFLDYKLWEKFNKLHGGGAERKLKEYVSTTMNNIQVIYSQPSMLPRLTFRIIRYEVMKSTPAALAGSRHSWGNAQKYLDTFCRYQSTLSYKNWDHAFLLSGYDIHQGQHSKSISGIARLKGMCDKRNSCTVTEGLDFTAVFIGAHEMGHSVGMGHDEPYCSSRYIMSASLGPGKTTWSTCSMRDYHRFLQRMDKRKNNCLRNSRQSSVMSIHSTSLPGQQYTANQQCALMHGSTYSMAKPRNDNANGICHMMWCGQRKFGRIITSHPALEGTICRQGRWCRAGRCDKYSSTGNVATPKPQLTSRNDGGWSGFSSVTCSRCQCPPIAGNNVGVLMAKRTCTNPTPSNGGAQCDGKDVMGIVCNSKCSSGRKTKQAYMDNICANHRETKRDYELTGKGIQLTRYAERACKIFCKVHNKFGGNQNYRFNGDHLPDGTVCHRQGGNAQYCVSGHCLPLTCSNSALSDRSMSCPSNKCSTNTKPSPIKPKKRHGRWSSWSAWSACSKTCGGGRKRRARYCTVNGACAGTTEESTNCNTAVCATVSRAKTTRASNVKWSAWSQYGSCTRTCGKGVKRRTRRCLNGSSCPGSTDDAKDCQLSTCATVKPLAWAAWSNWNSCSASCGNSGTRKRTRWCSGTGCPSSQKAEEKQACNHKSCGQSWTAWGSWTACSVTCDRGVMARYRRCEDGDKRKSKSCIGSNDERKDCRANRSCRARSAASPSWASWSAWSSCTTSQCNSWGVQKRSRSCSNGRKADCTGVPKQEMRCYKECATTTTTTRPTTRRAAQARSAVRYGRWSTWSQWNSCSRTCGSSGIKSRQRACSLAACQGPRLETISCNTQACRNNKARSIQMFNQWTVWSSCSRSCGFGQRQRFARCASSAPRGCTQKRQLETCNKHSCNSPRTTATSTAPATTRRKSNQPGQWSQWSLWSDCSHRCGGGQERKRRVCSTGDGNCPGKDIMSRDCHTRECATWGGWGHWGPCSQTCSQWQGTRRRIRNCYGWGECDGKDDSLTSCRGRSRC